MKALIETIVKPLVDHPEEVQVKEVPADRETIYKLSVHEDDMGKVIGKQGRIAKAIRTVLNVAAANKQQRIYLDIED